MESDAPPMNQPEAKTCWRLQRWGWQKAASIFRNLAIVQPSLSQSMGTLFLASLDTTQKKAPAKKVDHIQPSRLPFSRPAPGFEAHDCVRLFTLLDTDGPPDALES